MIKPNHILLLLVLGLGSLFTGVAQPASNFFSRIDGTFENNGTWSSSSHSGASSNSNPSCAINGNKKIYIEDSISSACSPMLINGNVDFIIRNGGKLEITGGLEIFGNATFEIDPTSRLTINGDLEVAGNGELVLDGDLIVNGDVEISGNADVCGNGNAQVSGSISGDGWCYGINVMPIDLISFEANVDQNNWDNIQLTWETSIEINNDYFILERSDNGMSFYEIATIDGAGTSIQNKSYAHTDKQLMPGTYYYRLSQVDFNGAAVTFEVVSISILQDAVSGACELSVNPNPCVPSCVVTLTDCEGPVYQTQVLDGAGRFVTELIPISNSEKDVIYHVSKSNFTLPGIYIIRSATASGARTKKVMIK